VPSQQTALPAAGRCERLLRCVGVATAYQLQQSHAHSRTLGRSTPTSSQTSHRWEEKPDWIHAAVAFRVPAASCKLLLALLTRNRKASHTATAALHSAIVQMRSLLPRADQEVSVRCWLGLCCLQILQHALPVKALPRCVRLLDAPAQAKQHHRACNMMLRPSVDPTAASSPGY
jgi:hypothetical protein